MPSRTGAADLPLHGGRAPRWLFERMASLAPVVVEAIVVEEGPEAVLERLSDPWWFQALGCVLGFDWHSSGVTTTVCGALKAGLAGAEADTGIRVAGGKGRASRKTPAELVEIGEATGLDGDLLAYNSRTAAKVDSAALQDGFQIYHHAFFVTDSGAWAVVQQGMREEEGTARRYHWLGSRVTDFVEEPHAAVASDLRGHEVLNLVDRESAGARGAVAELARESPETVLREVDRATVLAMPTRHRVDVASDVDPRRLKRILLSTYESQPADFERVLGVPGVGARSVRALSLVAELLYGERASVRDPARFSVAHGGKDGHPYPVDRETYDRSIAFLKDAVGRARIGRSERLGALKRLARWEDRPRAPRPRGSG